MPKRRAVKLFGDSIAANVFLLGYAYQLGCVPIGSAAIEQAIELNGAAVEMSKGPSALGGWRRTTWTRSSA